MSEVKQYAERDAMALDEAGGYYMRHVMAMTGEQLHGKADIAAELGWRDMQISALQQKLDAVLAENPDARRMDWLVSKCVEVRQPLRYGSAAMFRSHAITDEEDEHYATKLREQIDNAILSEGATND